MPGLLERAKGAAAKAVRERYPFYRRKATTIIRSLRSPNAPWHNAVLKDKSDVIAALKEIRSIGLYPHNDAPKNWDSLAALDCLLANTSRNARILDAGAETYSVILPWLALYGYKNLVGINLLFDKKITMGPVTYEYGDITRTKYHDSSFDAVTCLSVIEHGVDLPRYFTEMHRILKPGGILVTSTDYWNVPIDAKGQTMFGVPVHVFSEDEVRAAISYAESLGFELTSPIDLSCDKKVVYWKAVDLRYTFVNFSLQKVR